MLNQIDDIKIQFNFDLNTYKTYQKFKFLIKNHKIMLENFKKNIDKIVL
jgi:hypothetical protein